jgi:tetratricopeptide (TPR) repeat protein
VPALRVTWPVRAGVVPPLADCYTPRPETGLRYANNLNPGETTVLTDQAVADVAVPPGGYGKTQLALGLAHSLWEARAVDMLVWITASSRDAILTGFAQALGPAGAAVVGEDPESAAGRFLSLLAELDRPWLVVLDDVTDPGDLDGLWPQGSSGRVVVTSRHADLKPVTQNRRAVPVEAFTRREALSYLSAKFNNDPDQRLGALDLAEDLNSLPLALAQATAVMAERRLNCQQYRAQYAERRQHVIPAGTDDYSAIIAVTWSLCIDRADQLGPAGLAWPVLALCSLLDPNGIPGAVFLSRAACDYVTRHRGTPVVADEDQVRTAVLNLARLGLVTIDPASAARTVHVHTLVQAAVRKYLSAAEIDQAVRAAADALLQAWPDDDVDPLFAQALRDCAARLREVDTEALWAPEGHPLLFRAGKSLDNARLTNQAIAYWQGMSETSSRVLDTSHTDAYVSRDNLAAMYKRAGRLDEAITLYERALTEREWSLGADHRDTIAARGEVGRAYLAAGRIDDALAALEQALADHERILGADHLDTLTARGNLAAAYRTAGRLKDAIPLYRRTLEDREQIQGADHPDTLTARGNLAYAYRTAGRLKDAIPLYRRTLEDREQIQGADHPDTLTARGNLASAYHTSRRLKEAIQLYERNLADRERVQGADHPDTLAARGNLASAYHTAGRLADAIPLYERAFVDYERTLGPDHPDTLTSRGNLAAAYHTAGRLSEAVSAMRRTLADCERALGPDHPLTQTVSENLHAMQA